MHLTIDGAVSWVMLLEMVGSRGAVEEGGLRGRGASGIPEGLPVGC